MKNPIRLLLCAALLAGGAFPAPAQTLLSYWNFNNDATTYNGSTLGTFGTAAAAYGEAYTASPGNLASDTAGLYHGSGVYLDLHEMAGATYGGSNTIYSYGTFTDDTLNRIASDTTTGGSLIVTALNTATNPVNLTFALESTGYQNLDLSFAFRNKVPATITLSYSLDGTTWTPLETLGTNTSTGGDANAFEVQSYDLSGFPALNNLPAFYIRMTTTLTTGSFAIDNVQLTGLAVPEPPAWAYASAFGALVFLRRLFPRRHTG